LTIRHSLNLGKKDGSGGGERCGGEEIKPDVRAIRFHIILVRFLLLSQFENLDRNDGISGLLCILLEFVYFLLSSSFYKYRDPLHECTAQSNCRAKQIAFWKNCAMYHRVHSRNKVIMTQCR